LVSKATQMANVVAIFFCLIYSYLLLPKVNCNSDYLVIFRGKSKHTSLILPFNKWILPESELKHCYGVKFSDDYNFDNELIPIGKGQTFRRLFNQHSLENDYNQEDDSTDRIEQIQQIDSEMRDNDSNLQSPLFSLENNSDAANNYDTATRKYKRFNSEESLILASQKCILLHGLYEIWSEGGSVDEVVTKAENTIQYQKLLQKYEFNHNANNDMKNIGKNIEKNNCDINKNITNIVSIKIAASVLEQPWLSSQELKTTILDKFEHLWVKLDSNFKKKSEISLNDLGSTSVVGTEPGIGTRPAIRSIEETRPMEVIRPVTRSVIGTIPMVGTIPVVRTMPIVEIKVSVEAMNNLGISDSTENNDINDKTIDHLETINPSIEEFIENGDSIRIKNLDEKRASIRGTSLGLELDMRVYVDEVTGYCVLCRQLARYYRLNNFTYERIDIFLYLLHTI
jgi:hypothetical protein